MTLDWVTTNCLPLLLHKVRIEEDDVLLELHHLEVCLELPKESIALLSRGVNFSTMNSKLVELLQFINILIKKTVHRLVIIVDE